jgi:uncharacterized protein YydD (DUF2326 family)
MKLNELSADRDSFKKIRFQRQGVTLVVGDASKENSKEGSSNGVGKTLCLGLIHHMLGAKPNVKLAAAVPEWMFRLSINIGDKEHLIERSGDGKRIYLDGKAEKLAAYREWLNECGAFRQDERVPGITFRSLFTRFARYLREDCIDPVKTHGEKPVDSLIRSLYLLGANTTLAVEKKDIRLALDRLQKSIKLWKTDPALVSILRTGLQPKLRLEKLSREIEELAINLDKFQVAENFRQLESEASQIVQEIRDIDKEIAIRQFQLEGIEKALRVTPDISRSDLLALYEGLQAAFRPESLAHFEAVEGFHSSLANIRRSRLANDRLSLLGDVRALQASRAKKIDDQQARQMSLKGKGALDEYALIANRKASLEEERARLNAYLALVTTNQQDQQSFRERLIEEDRVAADYLGTGPVDTSNQSFQRLTEILYPKAPSGILLESNTSERSQSRYNLMVQIEGDDSDGINAARLLCFDWLLFMHGANHTLDFLWHDNRLFAHIDPSPRAAWFRHVAAVSTSSGKQYIASINTENFDAMRAHLEPEIWESLKNAVAVTLRGDRPENKLLGIQFGG